MEPDNVIKVVETLEAPTANKYLKLGWKILNVSASGQGGHCYSLGWVGTEPPEHPPSEYEDLTLRFVDQKVD